MPITKLFSIVLVALLISACKLTVVNEGGGVVTSASGHIDCGEVCIVNSSAIENNVPPFVEELIAYIRKKSPLNVQLDDRINLKTIQFN